MSARTSNVNQEKLQRLAELIKELVVVHGKVTLSSGHRADYHVDLRRVTLYYESPRLIGSLLRELTADWDYAYVSGLTLGTGPMATSVMHAEGRPIDTFVVHKEVKKHDMQRHVEGPDIVSEKVLVVGDTITTSNSPLTAIAALCGAGAEVVGVATVIDRATGADEAIKVEGLEYCYLLGLDDLGLA